ncbi:hypothetical protein [Nocardiopsis rhodophaea]|uniref:hypothetical protein n=1 Tax=Nocardiopsis rhodophaea TaxID=280238 RepID=UPI0031DD990B
MSLDLTAAQVALDALAIAAATQLWHDAGPENLVTERALCDETAKPLTQVQLSAEHVRDRALEPPDREKHKPLA